VEADNEAVESDDDAAQAVLGVDEKGRDREGAVGAHADDVANAADGQGKQAVQGDCGGYRLYLGFYPIKPPFVKGILPIDINPRSVRQVGASPQTPPGAEPLDLIVLK